MGLGWVIFKKTYEDESYIEYKYCHDSKEMDGTIKIIKELGVPSYVVWPNIDQDTRPQKMTN